MADLEDKLAPAEPAEITPADEVLKSGRMVCAVGILMVLATWGIGGVHVVVSTTVRATCNVGLRKVELWLAICNFVLGTLVFGGVICTKQMYGTVQNFVFVASQEAQGQTPEVQEMTRQARIVRGIVRITLVLQGVVAMGWLLSSMVAAIDTYAANLDKCGRFPVITFWPLAAINFSIIVIDAFVYKCVDV